MNTSSITLILAVLPLTGPACKSSSEGSAARAREPQAFVSQALDILRRSDAETWRSLLMTRDEYESRCALLVERNGEAWLDRKMASRDKDSAKAMEECSDLRSEGELQALGHGTRGD